MKNWNSLINFSGSEISREAKEYSRCVGEYPFFWTHKKNAAGELMMPPIDILDHIFSYNPTTGALSRIYTIKSGPITPREIKSKISAGYYSVGIVDSEGVTKFYLVHRICYFLYYGKDPVGFFVDHDDQNKINNKPGNFVLLDKKTGCIQNKKRSWLAENNSILKKV